MDREQKLSRIKHYVEKNSKNKELTQYIFNIIQKHKEKYTITRTNILINLSWACDECVDDIYTLVSNDV
jgi:hypothetical protein